VRARDKLLEAIAVIKDRLALPFETEVLGVRVTVERIDLTEADEMVALCRRGRTKQRIAVRDVPLPSPSPDGADSERGAMSEYQCYEFQVIDRPLSEREHMLGLGDDHGSTATSNRGFVSRKRNLPGTPRFATRGCPEGLVRKRREIKNLSKERATGLEPATSSLGSWRRRSRLRLFRRSSTYARGDLLHSSLVSASAAECSWVVSGGLSGSVRHVDSWRDG